MFSNFNKIFFTQKRPAIAVLLFFTLFSLLCSMTAFADNQSQRDIERHLGRGTPSCSLSKEDAEEFKDIVGHCYGLSVVWLYSKWLQFEHPEKASVYNDDWYKSTVTDIFGSWSNCDNIKKFASLVKELQISQAKGSDFFEKEMRRVDTDGKNIQKEYSIASLLTLEQLKQLLREDIIYDHKLILICSHNHATALFKDRDDYYYFDPNCPTGEHKVSSTDDVAELVFEANNFKLTKPSPLALIVFSFDERAQNYPLQEEILDRINPSLVSDNNYADEMTGLHLAAKHVCIESVRYFLSKGVNIDECDAMGWTALEFAAQSGSLEIIGLLYEERARLIKNYKNDGSISLRSAAEYGHLETVRLLLEKGVDPNSVNTALMFAAKNGHLEIVLLLLEKKAEPNWVDRKGYTTLMYAAKNGHLEIVRLLFGKGANPKLITRIGFTALMFAAKNGHPEIVQLLLETGADPNSVNKESHTALILAIQKGHFEVAKLLLEKGAKPDLIDEDGNTALRWAVLNGHLEIVRLLLEKGAQLDLVDERDWTALMLAAQNGCLEIVRLLLEKGADFALTNEDGETALIIARSKGYSEIAEVIEKAIKKKKQQKNTEKRRTEL